MKSRANIFLILRRFAAALSLLAMTTVFFVPAAARWLGWLPRLQLVPAILAGAVLEIVALAALALLFGRLYCSVVCPLGILQDLFRWCFGWICRPARAGASCANGDRPSPGAPKKDGAETKSERSPSTGGGQWTAGRILRDLILLLFLIAIPFGLTGLVEPYGIFGRFVATGIRQAGEPAVVTVVWALGLVAFILAMTLVRARWWCNRICPVGTFLGLFSRIALFRVRIDKTKCVKCGLCAKRCDKGALVVGDDRSVAVDPSFCVACGNCPGSCAKGALTFVNRSARVLPDIAK